MKKLLMAMTAMAALSSAAVAADIPVRAPAYRAPAAVPTFSWTGCYIGAGGGYGMWNQENQTVSAVTGAALDVVTTNGGRGWFGTAQVGCDYQFAGSWVIGAFGDWDFGRLRGQMTSTALGINGDEDLKWSWAAGGRIGYVIMPQLLGYISGGYTQARFSSVSFFGAVTGLATVPALSVNEQTYDGWFIGSGYEYGLNFILPGLFWKTEYRFASYNNNNDNNNRNVVLVAGVPGTTAINSEKWVQTIRSELVWRFNFGGF
jgi:outer membrane immunogenic protein